MYLLNKKRNSFCIARQRARNKTVIISINLLIDVLVFFTSPDVNR